MPGKKKWSFWPGKRPRTSRSPSDSPILPQGLQDGQSTLSAPARYTDLPNESTEGLLTPNLPYQSPGKLTPQTSPRSEPVLSRQGSSNMLHQSIAGLESPSILDLVQSITHNNHRPWKNSPSKHLWFVPTEQTVMHDETRKRVAQAVSCSLGLSGNVINTALFAGVELMQYVPIPGLEAAGRALLQIWDAAQQVVYNRMRCLRLAMRSADFLISIRAEIAQLNDVVGKQLEVPLRRFEETLLMILHTLQQQVILSGLERYLKREQLTQLIDDCNIALGDCLRSFDRSVILRIADNTMVRRQSYPQPLLLRPDEESEPLGQLDIPVSLSPIADEPEQEKLEVWRRLEQEDNEADAVQDDRDFQALLEYAVNTRDESEVIRLLRIGHSGLPRALVTLLTDAFAIRRTQDEKKASHRDGGHTTRSRSRSQTWPFDRHDPTGGNGPRRQPTTDSSESILHKLEALRRESRGHPSVVRSWDIARDDVRLGDVIGRGHFSTVYKGIWRGRTVAVKVLNPTTVSKDEFNNELIIWRLLSTKGTSGISKLYGSSSVSGGLPRMLVSPYMQYGSLSDYLKRCEWDAAGKNPALFLQRGPYEVDHSAFMRQIARGMKFIHENGILHGDLRASNVLVNDQIKCVIADFGCSKFITKVTFEDPFPTHALRWQAPEIMYKRSTRSTEGDVYAYAMTCVEITTFGNIPWPTLSDDLVKEEVLKKKARPPTSSLVQELKIRPLLQRCWDDAPASRPSFKDITSSLQNLQYPQVEK